MKRFSWHPSLYIAFNPIGFRFEFIWGYWVFLIQTGPMPYRIYTQRPFYFGRKL